MKIQIFINNLKMFFMKNFMRKLETVAFFAILSVSNILAQSSKGAGALTQAEAELKGYITPVTNIFYVVCAIMAIIGAFKVFSKWSSGDPDTTKVAASWGGALIFALISITAIRLFFL